MNNSDIVGNRRGQRFKLLGAFDFSKSFLLPATHYSNIDRVPLVGRGIGGVECQSLLVLRLSSGKIPVVLHLVAAQNSMGTSQGRVQFQGFAGRRVRLRIV